MKDRLPIVADILMGAAHADSHLHGDEKAAVQRLLRQLLGGEALPMDLAFDLGEAAAAFTGETPENKRRLLELVSAVHAADQEYDLSEDEFVHRLAGALGLAEESYRDLAVTVVEEIDLGKLR